MAQTATPAGVVANVGGNLKRRYHDKFIRRLAWDYGAAGAMIPRIGTTGFASWAMQLGNSPAVSADLPTAQTISGDTGYTAFVQAVYTDYMRKYGIAAIDGLLMRIAGNKDGSFFYDKFVGQLDGILKGILQAYSWQIYGDGFGAVSTIKAGSAVSGTTLTLEFPEDIVRFERGMYLDFSSANSTAGLRANFSTIDPAFGAVAAGTLTLTANVNTNSAAAGDAIFMRGDRQDSTTPTRKCVFGFEAWLNTTTTVYGMTRTDPRLTGVVIDAATNGWDAEETIVRGLIETSRFGGNVDKVFMNMSHGRNIVLKNMSRVRPLVVAGPGGKQFKGITLQLDSGDNVDIVYDRFCRQNRIMGLEMDSWRMFLADPSPNPKFPMFLDDDGNTILRLGAADGVEGRAGFYGDLACNAPIHNFVGKMATIS